MQRLKLSLEFGVEEFPQEEARSLRNEGFGTEFGVNKQPVQTSQGSSNKGIKNSVKSKNSYTIYDGTNNLPLGPRSF